MTLLIIVAAVITGLIAGWWLTITIITTIRSHASTRIVRQWQDRALAAEEWRRARQFADRGDDDTPRAA